MEIFRVQVRVTLRESQRPEESQAIEGKIGALASLKCIYVLDIIARVHCYLFKSSLSSVRLTEVPDFLPFASVALSVQVCKQLSVMSIPNEALQKVSNR